jgi:pimeloyl-ACP methyl ester carboxylesterase
MASASRAVTLSHTLAAVLAVSVIAVATAAQAQAGSWGAGAGKSKGVGRYADVNGIKLYYEIRGVGRPLVLLHGGLGAIEMFGPNLPALAKGRQVIAVDLQGHGRTADIDRPLSVELMADDIAALLKHLGIERSDIMGYSLGGGVALQTAIRHPEVVSKLVVVSTPFRRSGFYPEILAQQGQVGPTTAEAMKQTPMYQMYRSLAPRPDDWARLLGKIGEAMKQDFDFSKEIAGIKATTLIVAGDADIFPPAHAVELFGLLGGGQRDGGWDGSGRPKSRLAILPGLTHYTMFSAPALVATVIPFLDEPAPKKQ